jgi:hypothetical protein
MDDVGSSEHLRKLWQVYFSLLNDTVSTAYLLKKSKVIKYIIDFWLSNGKALEADTKNFQPCWLMSLEVNNFSKTFFLIMK